MTGRHRSGRFGGEISGYLGHVRGTASVNLALTALGSLTGLLVARMLGATGRGSFAAIAAYMGLGMTLGQSGMAAAICYFVAHRRREAADVTRTSLRLLLVLGVATGIVGVAIARPLFGDRPQVVEQFRYVAAAQPLIFMAIAYIFTLQATSMRAWNAIRLSQPVIYATLLGGLAVARAMTLRTVVASLLIACLMQAALARVAARRSVPSEGRYRSDLAGPLLRYGLTNLAASMPYVVNSQLDQLLLAVLVPPHVLGQYAVAVSLSLLGCPLAVAFGSVALPRVAASTGQGHPVEAGLIRTAVAGSFLIGAIPSAGLVVLSPILLTRLLGPSYGGAVPLLYVLAPGAVLLSCNRVMGDILRGFNRSLTVARCEGVAAVVTLACLGGLVPKIGVMGAAIASTAAYLTSFVMLLRSVSTLARRPLVPAQGAPTATDPVAVTAGTDPVAVAAGTDPVAIAAGTDPVASPATAPRGIVVVGRQATTAAHGPVPASAPTQPHDSRRAVEPR